MLTVGYIHEVVPRLLGDVEATAVAAENDHALIKPLARWLGLANWARDRAVLFVEPVHGSLLPEHEIELRAAMAVKLGMERPEAGDRTPSVSKWALSEAGAACMLRDPTGACFARFLLVASLAWHSRKSRQGNIVVIYGTRIGVRCPAGVPLDAYGDRDRQEELLDSLKARTVAWAVVAT